MGKVLRKGSPVNECSQMKDCGSVGEPSLVDRLLALHSRLGGVLFQLGLVSETLSARPDCKGDGDDVASDVLGLLASIEQQSREIEGETDRVSRLVGDLRTGKGG